LSDEGKKRHVVLRASDTFFARRWRLSTEVLSVVFSKARAGHLPAWRQLAEMLALKVLRGQTLRFYLYGRFWRREMPWREKWHHLNYREYMRLLDACNDKSYRKALENKLVQKSILTQRGLPTPPLLGFFHPDLGWQRDGSSLRSASDLRRLLEAWRGERIVCKTPHTYGGKNFLSYAIRRAADAVRIEHPLTHDEYGLEEVVAALRKSPEGYVIETHYAQHPEMAAFNPTSLNTIRSWVFRGESGWRVVGAYVRVGRRDMMTDNIAGGGMVCLLDPRDGSMLELLRGDLSTETLPSHPDTGFVPTGRKVPFWPEVLGLSLVVFEGFPRTNLGALDIAVGPDGPAIIEANVSLPGQVGFARFEVPGRWLFPEIFGPQGSRRPRWQ
jgi:hypothetical protein